MYRIYEDTPELQITKYFGPAKVISFDKKDKTAELNIETDEGKFKFTGKIAIPNCPSLAAGDLVLAAGEDIKKLFIIGIIEQFENNAIENKRLELNNGIYAEVDKYQEGEKIQIRSKEGELLFEYDAAQNNTRVKVGFGNLEFITQKGDINFISEGNINFKSKQSVIIESFDSIRATIINTIDKVFSSLTFNRQKIKMSSPELEIVNQRTDIMSEETKYIGNKFSGTFKYGKLIAGKLETLADDIICKAKNIYNSVDGLAQFKAGRIRTLIKNSLHVKAKNSYLKSEEDFKINGEKIHLG